jgi:hypothetical protein
MMDTSLRLRSRYLLDAGFWRERLARLRSTPRSLFFTPRPDLSGPLVEVDEWRLRAHDGERLWGLRVRPSFQTEPAGASIRFVAAPGRPEVAPERVAGGREDWIAQIPAGRRLEDRVLDLVRLTEVVVEVCGQSQPVRFHSESAPLPDEAVICTGLRERGII